jgi:hypothetical protein
MAQVVAQPFIDFGESAFAFPKEMKKKLLTKLLLFASL